MEKKVDPVIDRHKIHLHPEKEMGWKAIGDCYPIHIEIGVTSRCNHKCVFCALDFIDYKGVDIDTQIMVNALKDMGNPEFPYKITVEYGEEKGQLYDRVKSVMFGGEGEPTLHKDLGLLVQTAKKAGLDVALTTNGSVFCQRLQEECLPYLSWIKFSMDAGTPKTYEQIHGVSEKNFPTLLNNIKSSSEFKKKHNLEVAIGTQFLMIPQNTNKEEITSAITILEEVNPDYISIKPYSDHPQNKKDLIVTSPKYKELEEAVNSLKEKSGFNIFFRGETLERIQESNPYPNCEGLPFISLVDAQGNVLPCNIFYGKKDFQYGNLYNNSFSEIWQSTQRQEVLRKIQKKGMKECRPGCRCDAGNVYLQRLKKPLAHDNFT